MDKRRTTRPERAPRMAIGVSVIAALLVVLGSSTAARAAESAQPATAAKPAKPAKPAQTAKAQRRSTEAAPRRGLPADEIRRSFDAADLDHDGFISLDEFHQNALAAWNTLDTNHDGYISREELEPLPRALRRSLLGSLRHADTDGDLRLSFKEVMTARMADFNATDTNGDGRLSLEEVMRFRSPRRADGGEPR